MSTSGVYRVRVGERELTVRVVSETEDFVEVEVEGSRLRVSVERGPERRPTETRVEAPAALPKPPAPTVTPTVAPSAPAAAAPGVVSSKVPGRVKEVRVKEGETVQQGQVVVLMESMKMEVEVRAHRSGVVKAVYAKPGQYVSPGAPLILIE